MLDPYSASKIQWEDMVSPDIDAATKDCSMHRGYMRSSRVSMRNQQRNAPWWMMSDFSPVYYFRPPPPPAVIGRPKEWLTAPPCTVWEKLWGQEQTELVGKWTCTTSLRCFLPHATIIHNIWKDPRLSCWCVTDILARICWKCFNGYTVCSKKNKWKEIPQNDPKPMKPQQPHRSIENTSNGVYGIFALRNRIADEYG